MLQIEGLVAACAWALLGLVVLASLSPEDKRDGGLMLVLSLTTFVAVLFSEVPSVAKALQLFLTLQALLVLVWLVRHKLLRRSGRER